MFLKKVANDRDERRWAGRAEQVRHAITYPDQSWKDASKTPSLTLLLD